MRTTTLKCDRCGESWDPSDRRQFWPVAVVLGHEGAGALSGYGTKLSHIVKQQEWCRPCIDTVGLLSGYQEPKPGEQAPPQPTLEDLIREIARETAEEVASENT